MRLQFNQIIACSPQRGTVSSSPNGDDHEEKEIRANRCDRFNLETGSKNCGPNSSYAYHESVGR